MLTITGAAELRRDLAALAQQLREAQRTGVTVQAGGGNEIKLVMLAATGRDVTEIDAELESKIGAIFEAEISRACERVGKGLSGSLLGGFQKVGKLMVDTIKGRLLDTLPTPSGKRALSEDYAARKARKYPGKPIGVATEALVRSITAIIERG